MPKKFCWRHSTDCNRECSTSGLHRGIAWFACLRSITPAALISLQMNPLRIQIFFARPCVRVWAIDAPITLMCSISSSFFSLSSLFLKSTCLVFAWSFVPAKWRLQKCAFYFFLFFDFPFSFFIYFFNSFIKKKTIIFLFIFLFHFKFCSNLSMSFSNIDHKFSRSISFKCGWVVHEAYP